MIGGGFSHASSASRIAIPCTPGSTSSTMAATSSKSSRRIGKTPLRSARSADRSYQLRRGARNGAGRIGIGIQNQNNVSSLHKCSFRFQVNDRLKSLLPFLGFSFAKLFAVPARIYCRRKIELETEPKRSRSGKARKRHPRSFRRRNWTLRICESESPRHGKKPKIAI